MKKLNDQTLKKATELRDSDQFPFGREDDNTPTVATLAVLKRSIIGAALSIDPNLANLEGLFAIPAQELAVKTTIKAFIDADGTLQIWQLVAGAKRHKPADGIGRPNDYHATNNQKIWRKLAL